MKVYFDNAATTKVRDEVIDEISSVLKNCFGNPSSTHSFGRSAKSYIETSRKSIAKILNNSKFSNQYYFSSFDLNSLIMMKEILPNANYGFLIHEFKKDIMLLLKDNYNKR